MKHFGVALLSVAVLVIGWFLASPLFIDRAVDESFDFVSIDGQVDMTVIMAMSPDKRQAMMPDIMDAAARAPDRAASESMPANAPQAVANGEFVDADAIHKGSGHATVYALSDGKHVVRFEDFRATNGPALVVYLAKHPSPTQARHVTDGGFLSLGKLKGNVGNQNYAVPPETNIAEYQSVVIWCELFGVLFSPAALTRA
ncbi:MAG: DM13 domain-containing protein [Gammaproteobacteria bacterium]|nr:DM13 domain-containing protein [Gammaproteobacteria bacterium]